jgi:hypothetical protein
MNEREFRCPLLSILFLALLMVLPSLGAADEGPRISPQARAEFEAVAPPQAAGCRLCAFAHQQCSAACFGRDKIGECLTACDNAAVNCTCDEAVGLRSEELVNFEWPSLAKAACHGNVSCQPNYPSCASWSSYSDCGDPFCGFGARCGPCEWIEGRLFCEPGDAWKQSRERFRVCFDQFGNSCTEWQQILTSSCGC